MTDEKKFNPSHTIYKPNFKDSSKGCATSWEWNPKTSNFFMTIAKQSSAKSDSGKPTFAWKDSSEIFKLDMSDLAEISLVFSGQKEKLGQDDGNKGKGLFHQNKSGNSILKLYKLDEGFALELSTKKGEQRFWAGHRISLQESKVLSVIIDRCIWEMFSASR